MSISQKHIEEAIEILKNGGCVVYPTETAYGIAADATNHEAVERVVAMKGRPADYPFAVIAASLEMVERCGDMGEIEHEFAQKHWPGPLTVILQNASQEISPRCMRDQTVGVRVSSHPVACALSGGIGRPITATSANVHGKPTAYDVASVKEQMEGQDDKPDMYLDAGPLPERPPSMIIEVVDGELLVHRKGSFKL